MPELAQLLRGKSMMRYFPPKYTAGLAIFFVSSYRRVPRPPARIIAIILFFFMLTTLHSECIANAIYAIIGQTAGMIRQKPCAFRTAGFVKNDIRRTFASISLIDHYYLSSVLRVLILFFSSLYNLFHDLFSLFFIDRSCYNK